MRNYLLLLLLVTFGLQAQTLPSPAYNQTTTNTLKVKTPATITSVNFLPGFDADGITLSKINPILLPLSTATINAINVQDGTVLHKTGNETFSGIKTSVNTGATQINGLDLTNDGTSGSQVLFLTNNQTGAGAFFRNMFSGQGLSGDNANIGVLVNLNSRTASTGNLLNFRKNGVTTSFFDHNGILNASGILSTNETANTIASFDASKNLKSLPLATYPSLAELSYMKGVTSSVQTQLNTKATDSNVLHKTGDEVKTGSLTVNSLILPENVSGATAFKIGQVMSINDYWNIYGSSAVTDRGDLVFEVGDNGLPGITGQRFRFFIKSGSSGVDKDPLIVEYDKITATTDITSSQTVTGQSLAVDTGAVLFPTNTAYGGTGIPLILRSSNKLGFRSSITSNSQLLFNTDAVASDQTATWRNLSGTVAYTSDIPYLGVKTYTALINQSSTGAPTVSVLGTNTIGSIVWTRTGTGTYVGTLSGAFTANKTACTFNNTVFGSVTIQQTSVNTITITTADLTGTLMDSRLTNNTIKIEVYP